MKLRGREGAVRLSWGGPRCCGCAALTLAVIACPRERELTGVRCASGWRNIGGSALRLAALLGARCSTLLWGLLLYSTRARCSDQLCSSCPLLSLSLSLSLSLLRLSGLFSLLFLCLSLGSFSGFLCSLPSHSHSFIGLFFSFRLRLPLFLFDSAAASQASLPNMLFSVTSRTRVLASVLLRSSVTPESSSALSCCRSVSARFCGAAPFWRLPWLFAQKLLFHQSLNHLPAL